MRNNPKTANRSGVYIHTHKYIGGNKILITYSPWEFETSSERLRIVVLKFFTKNSFANRKLPPSVFTHNTTFEYFRPMRLNELDVIYD